jgi:hypothetical protein
LRFQVNADRALDITRCDYKGMPLAWRSPAGDVHPANYESAGSGWLRSFSGGLLTTCGLDQFGLPAKDSGAEFGLHGRISNTPAAQLNFRTYWDQDDYKLEITAEVRQAALFGENLALKRCITAALGSNSIHIADTITNYGFEPAAHMLLYHFNLGFPLVSEAAQLLFQVDNTQPRDEAARSDLDVWNQCQPPTPGYQEQVFIHRPKPDEDGLANVELSNPQIGLGVRWRYTMANLPYLMQWKMMGQGAYVVGVEPANCNGLAGRAVTREQGQLPVLDPEESRIYSLNVEVIDNQK